MTSIHSADIKKYQSIQTYRTKSKKNQFSSKNFNTSNKVVINIVTFRAIIGWCNLILLPPEGFMV